MSKSNHPLTMLQSPQEGNIYMKTEDMIVFKQLGVKINIGLASNDEYFAWLDRATKEIGGDVPGTQIMEKENARTEPTLNTTVYYDTIDYKLLPTGALLRTSCNKITHAFCAFKQKQDEYGVRRDYRYVFGGLEKETIQRDPTSDEAVSIVRRLLTSEHIDNPGLYLFGQYGIKGSELFPAIRIDNYRSSFYVWFDKLDGLRCSLDRAYASDLRPDIGKKATFGEVELSIYPRISPDVANDPRLVRTIEVLAKSLCLELNAVIVTEIKYQRAAKAIGISF